MEPPLRNAKRKSDQEPSKKAGPSVRLEPEAARLLKAQAQKLRVKEVRFASAAIAYFAENGLDPTVERPREFYDLGAQMSKEVRANHVLNLEIANQLFSLLQGWEKNLYAFLQQQQGSTLNYLEQIENNLLRHQVEVESSLVKPLVQQIIRGNMEANTIRKLATKLFIEATHKADTGKKKVERYQEQKAQQDDVHTRSLKSRLGKFYETQSVPKPVPTPKPQVMAAPAKAPKAGPGTEPTGGTAPK